MATFRVVDADGDWYETDGDPAVRFERMRARAVKAEGERDEAIIRAEDGEAEAARLQQHADWAKDGRDDWYRRAKDALAEIDAVAAALIAAGITYPLGARGVRDLANQRDCQQERAEEGEAGRDEDVRAVDAYLVAAAVLGERDALAGDPFLSLRARFIARIAELDVRDRIAEVEQRDSARTTGTGD